MELLELKKDYRADCPALNKKTVEKNISNFISTDIEWISINNIKLSSISKEDLVNFLDILNEDDDVQNVFTNVIL